VVKKRKKPIRKTLKKKNVKKTLTSREVAQIIAQAAYDVKADQLDVLDLRKFSTFTDFFVVATGRSDRQVQAICDRIEERMKKKKRIPLGIEGYAKGHWVLIDFGEVVGHVFYSDVREFYSLEKLWGDAPRVQFKLK
jgi:ribosome-associated protein